MRAPFLRRESLQFLLKKARKMRIILRIFYVLLILFGITFAALNAHPVEVHFYIAEFKMPAALLIVMTFFIGVVFGYLVMMKRYLWEKRENYRMKSQLDLMEKEVKNLRIMPVTEDY